MSGGYSRILVTGGAGFIGSHLIDRLFKDGFEVTAIDNLSRGRLENVIHHEDKKGFRLIKGDIRNFDLIQRTLQSIDVVFHQAAVIDGIYSADNFLLTNEVNVKGTLVLLKACLNSNVQRFIYASSAAVYGDTRPLPHHENLIPHPISEYGISKFAAESYIELFKEVYDLDFVCLRYFNVYGPRQVFDQQSGVIPKFINHLLNDQQPIIYGQGDQTRDFINIKDVVDANMLALTKENVAGQVFNVGSGIPTTVNTVAKLLAKIIGRTDLNPIYLNLRIGDIKHSYADTAKARKVLEHNPKVLLKEGLIKLVDWYKSQIHT